MESGDWLLSRVCEDRDLAPGTPGVVGRLRACGVPTAGGESPALEAWILLLVNSWLRDSAPRVPERSVHRETDT